MVARSEAELATQVQHLDFRHQQQAHRVPRLRGDRDQEAMLLMTSPEIYHKLVDVAVFSDPDQQIVPETTTMVTVV